MAVGYESGSVTRPWPPHAVSTPLDTIQAGLLTVMGLAILAAFIHAAVVPEHIMGAQEGAVPFWLPLAFAGTAAVGLTWAMATLWTGPQPGWLAVGLVLHAGMAVTGIVSRTIGLPGMDVEGPTTAFLVATAAELAVAVGCALLLANGVTRPREHAPRARTLLIVAGFVVVAAALSLLLVGPDTLDHAQMLGKWVWRMPHLVGKYMW